MPFQTSITLKDDRLRLALDQLADTFRTDGLEQVLRVVAQRVSILLAIEYPPQSNAPLPRFYRWSDGKLHKFKSLAQQRKVFALLKEGKIPYRRKNNLMEGARFRVVPVQGGVELNVTLQGNKGKYVFGKFQSHYFRKYTQWKQDPFNLQALEQRGQVSAAVLLAIESLNEELER